MATRKTAVKAETSTSAVKATTVEEATVKTAAAKAVKETIKAEKEVEKTSVKEAVKTEEPAKETEKPAAKKTAAKKPAAKRTTTKKAVKKETVTEVFVQFGGREVYAKDVVTNIKKIWTEELGKKEEELEDLKVYMKPEENKAYYVFNGDVTGSVEL